MLTFHSAPDISNLISKIYRFHQAHISFVDQKMDYFTLSMLTKKGTCKKLGINYSQFIDFENMQVSFEHIYALFPSAEYYYL